MDYRKLKKPTQVGDDVWRQHLSWMEVVGKQLDENIAKRRKQLKVEQAQSVSRTGGDERETMSRDD